MKEVNIALEIMQMIITALLTFHCILEKDRTTQTKLFIAMLGGNFLVSFADMMTWILPNQVDDIILHFFNFWVYSIGYIISTLFTEYLFGCIAQKTKVNKKIAGVIGTFCMLAVLLVIISMFNHMYFRFEEGIYYRGPLYWLSQMYPIAIILIDTWFVLHYRKELGSRSTISLLSYAILPILAMSIQIAVYGITLLYTATTLSLLIIYLSVHLEQGQELKEKKAKLSSMRISIMLSQIQPHFLYNSLTAIQKLCDIEPQAAKKALGEFSYFLRGNMDSLTSEQPIHFSRELEHVKNYLYLEEIRFQEKLNIVYDLQEEDFFLPALTLQPIVENAVKYGIGNKRIGGTVWIMTQRQNNQIMITVKDNGEGVDADCIEKIPEKKDGRTHVGLSNVRERIRTMSKGDMFFHSRVNEGTIVTVIVPN